MATIRVSTVVAAAPSVVWEDLRHISRHVEWMHDAESIRFLTDAVEGIGVRFECSTRIGPIRLADRMEVTEWSIERAMGIRHVGVVSGEGRFSLGSTAGPDGVVHTNFEWTETLRFPWWMGGAIGSALAGPVLRAIWNRNLCKLARRFI